VPAEDGEWPPFNRLCQARSSTGASQGAPSGRFVPRFADRRTLFFIKTGASPPPIFRRRPALRDEHLLAVAPLFFLTGGADFFFFSVCRWAFSVSGSFGPEKQKRVKVRRAPP